jgi:MtN3 and saliva related transmembrane protein
MEDYDGFILPAIGFVATGFAVSSTVPQISKALRTKKSDDISLRFIVVLIIGLPFWVIYGIGKRDVVLIIGNSIAVILNTILLILKIKYSRDPLREEW